MEFRRLSDVSLIEEASDIANVLIEENGEIKRVPKTQVGGIGFPTAIIKDANYDSYLGGVQPKASGDPICTCLNMTFEEAHEIISNGEILEAIGMLVNYYEFDNPVSTMTRSGATTLLDNIVGLPCICFSFWTENFYWTENEISNIMPGSSPK